MGWIVATISCGFVWVMAYAKVNLVIEQLVISKRFALECADQGVEVNAAIGTPIK